MRCDRAAVTAFALALGLALSACETSNFGDKIQDTINDMNLFGSNKKPLPGERKQVFPQGVPGVTQGVPPDLLPGGQQANVQAAPTPAAQPAPQPVKKKRVAAKKKVPRPAPTATPAAAPPPPADGVWPPPPSSAPPPADGVWPPPPR